MRKRRFFKKTAWVACILVCGILIGQGSPESWAIIGQKLAMVSVGMQKPADSVRVLSGQVQDALAIVKPTELLPSTTACTTLTTSITQATTLSTTSPTVAAAATAIPQKATGAGKVSEQLMSGGGAVQGVALRNISGKTFDIAAELKKGTSVRAQKNADEPQVLLVHTHTTENYLTYDTGYFNPSDIERTFDTSRNIVAAGAALAAALEKAGVRTLHDTTVHDNPQYTGAYSRSEKTVKALLEKYPSIKVVIDVHRDAIMPDDNTHVKPTVTIDGKKAAQLMLVMGVVNSATLPHPNWQSNFSLALQVQKRLADTYPNLARPMYVTASRYNQHLSAGYMLVEVGSDVNTVDEAVYSATLLGNLLAELLTEG